jgi:hypothetical protein
VQVSRKDQAADMLLDGMEIPIVAAATGLQELTITHIRRRLDKPVGGDPNWCGSGLLKCRLCGLPYSGHPMRRCAAGA